MQKNEFINKKGNFGEKLMHKLYSKKSINYLANSYDSNIKYNFDINDYMIKSNKMLNDKLKFGIPILFVITK